MNTQYVNEWLSFMRTGGPNGRALPKGRLQLRYGFTGYSRYCCLGAACEVAAQKGDMERNALAYFCHSNSSRLAIPSKKFALTELAINRNGDLTAKGSELVIQYLCINKECRPVSLASINDYILKDDDTLEGMANLIAYLYYCQDLGVQVFEKD